MKVKIKITDKGIREAYDFTENKIYDSNLEIKNLRNGIQQNLYMVINDVGREVGITQIFSSLIKKNTAENRNKTNISLQEVE